MANFVRWLIGHSDKLCLGLACWFSFCSGVQFIYYIIMPTSENLFWCLLGAVIASLYATAAVVLLKWRVKTELLESLKNGEAP